MAESFRGGSIQFDHPIKKFLSQKREEVYKFNRIKLSHNNILGKSSKRLTILDNKLSNNNLIKNLDFGFNEEERFEKEINNIEFELEYIKQEESKDDIALINYIKEKEKLLNSSKGIKNGFIALLSYIMKKRQKSDTEKEILKYYFLSIEKLVSLLLPLEINVNDIIKQLSLQINFEKKMKNNILWKEGDQGEKMYIILKGNVGVLPQKESEGECTKLEYIKYLIILYLYQENSLISKIIQENSKNIEIAENNFFILLSIFKFYQTFTHLKKFKKKYRTISDFLEGEQNLKEYLFNQYKLSPIESLKLLDYSEDVIKELYDFYTHLITEINNEFAFSQKSRHKSVNENILFKSKLMKKVMTLLELYVNKNYKYKKFNELFDKIMSIKEIDTSKIYEGSIKDYLNRLDFKKAIKKIRKYELDYHKDNILNKISEKTIKIIYINYCEVAQLNDGHIFGELALRYFNKQRNATVITKSECYFGTLTKPIYDICLKTAQDKIRIRNVLFFTNGPIFKGITVNYFLNKFFYLLHKKNINQNEYLFRTGEKREKIYFIIKGELKLKGKMTLSELSEEIKDLGGIIDDFQMKDIFYECPQFKKLYNEQIFNIDIFSLKDSEIAGLDDMTANNKYLFDCVCISPSKTELFELDYTIFEDCLRKEKIVSKNHESYINIKRKINVKRILEQRNNLCLTEINKIRTILGNKTKIKKEKNILKEGYIPIIYPESQIKKSPPLKSKVIKLFEKPIEKNLDKITKKKFDTIKFKNNYLIHCNNTFLKPSLTKFNENLKNENTNNKLSFMKLSKNKLKSALNLKMIKQNEKYKQSNNYYPYKTIKLKLNTDSNIYNSSSTQCNKENSNIKNSINYSDSKDIDREYFRRIYNKPFIPDFANSRIKKNIVPFLNKTTDRKISTKKRSFVNPPIFLKETSKKYIEKRYLLTETNFYKDNQYIFNYLLKDNNKSYSNYMNKSENKNIKNIINNSSFNYSMSNKIENSFSLIRNENHYIPNIFQKNDKNIKNSGIIDCLFLDNWEEKTQFENKILRNKGELYDGI